MRTFYIRTLGVIRTLAQLVITFWFFLRDIILTATPAWIPRAQIAMFLVAMPPVILDWYFAGLEVGIAIAMRAMIAGTKVLFAERFYAFRCSILKPDEGKPSWLRRVSVDGPLYSAFHATLFVSYGTLVHNFITPLNVEGAATELMILAVGGLITGPFWMRTIFDVLHETEYTK